MSAGSVQTVSHPFVDKRESAMREHVCHVHHLLFMIDESLSEYMFPQTVPHHIFLKRDLNQGYISRIHDLCVVSERSVSENVFYKVAADGLTPNF